MKKILLTVAITLSTVAMYGADISVITNVLQQGNASLLTNQMDTQVDISVPGNSQKGGEQDAIALLSSFFQANAPTAFSVVHHADKNDAGFLVGKLQAGGKEYRVNVTYCIKDGKTLIQSIRIE